MIDPCSALRANVRAFALLKGSPHGARSLWPVSPCREILVQVYEMFRHPLRSLPCGSVPSPHRPLKLRLPTVLPERPATTRAECEARAPKPRHAGHLPLRTESK